MNNYQSQYIFSGQLNSLLNLNYPGFNDSELTQFYDRINTSFTPWAYSAFSTFNLLNKHLRLIKLQPLKNEFYFLFISFKKMVYNLKLE